MKQRSAVTLVLLLGIASCPVANCAFAIQGHEAPTYVDSNGIRFKVPPGYEQHKNRNARVVIFATPSNRQSTSYGLLKVYFEHRPTDIPGHELTPEKMELFGLTKIGQKRLKFAGHEGGCVEYSVKSKTGIAIIQAECSFGSDLHTSFFGSPQNLRDFYDFMQSATTSAKEQQT